jgi:hypothetical protein
MTNLIRIYVHPNLPPRLEDMRKKIASDLKQKYGLSEITINGGLITQILAAKLNHQKFIDVKIRKTGLNTGVLELL